MPRATGLLGWLDARGDDLVILTETSGGEGTRYLLDQCRRAGLDVIHTPDLCGDRGVAIISRVPITARPDLIGDVVPQGRVVAATVAGAPELTVIGIYVPSSDRAPDKVIRKQTFITSLLTAMQRLPDQTRARLVLGGDYNVISRDHDPPYRSFLEFEYGMLDTLCDLGMADAFQHCAPRVQAHSWIGRGGNGYRFDYFHIGTELIAHAASCSYLHEPRQLRLSDHAAVSLTLTMPPIARLDIDPAGLNSAGTLF